MNKRRGYAIPLSLCVAGVTLFLGLSAAQMSAGDLGVSSHHYYQERARQMADYGLERCVVASQQSHFQRFPMGVPVGLYRYAFSWATTYLAD